MKRQFDTAALFRWAVILGVLLCLTLAVGGTPARADTEGAATVTATALNLRSEPDMSGTVLSCLPRGTVVLVTGQENGWYKIWYRGESGYMSKDYLSFETTAQSSFGTGVVDGSYVNVRSGPGTGYSSLGQVNDGAELPVTGVSGAWLRVSYKDADAYIHSAYLAVSYITGGSSAPTASPAPQTEEQTTGVITGNGVCLRSGPGTGYAILGAYNAGTKMTITGSSGDWYAVSCNGVKGYVYKQYLSQSGVTASVTEMEEELAVTTAGVNLREGPSTAYTSTRVLSAGVSVTVTGKSGQWYRVNYGGMTGFIHQDYLSLGGDSRANTAGSTAGEQIVATAKKYMGVRYVYGGTSPSGFDCSGLVYYVYKQCGYSITRTATSQSYDGKLVARADMQPGDIIIFYNGAKSAIGHAGIYIGNNQFIHASSGGGRVMISSLSESYYNTRFYCARRVV